LLGFGSVHASLIEGGQEMSSYPERCVVCVERRTVPGEDAEAVRAELETIVASARADDPGLEAAVEVTLSRDPFRIGEGETIVREMIRAAERHGPARVVGSAAWMDAAVFAAAGIPTVVYGPDGGGLHAAVEWVDLASLERLREALEEVATRFCGGRRE
jgi:acetylornithine deacetylase